MSRDYILGLDIGTSGCKAVVFDADGLQKAKAFRRYSVVHPHEGWMELDPDRVADCVFACIRECTGQCNATKIRALAVSSQGEAIIPVGKDGRVLANAIVTFDNRNKAEYEWFSAHFNKMEIMHLTGVPIHPMFSITKILWIKNNLPDVFSETWKFMCFGDFISFRLGAFPAMDYSMASRTMAFDLQQKQWSSSILSLCGIAQEKLPEPVPSGAMIGTIHPDVCAATGLSDDVLIIAGGHDQACCALGAGVFNRGVAMDSLGTTESIVCVDDRLHITPNMLENNIPCNIYPVEGLYSYMGFLSTSGAILEWFRDFTSQDISFHAMDEATLLSCPGPSGLMLMPHFAGSGTPYLDFGSKGMLSGLTLSTSKQQMYKAILEGTNLEVKLNLDCMEKSGIFIEELHCVGGGAKSPLWLQLKADITGKKVVSYEIEEYGCLGAAILAGLGAGIYTDPLTIQYKFLHGKREYLPDPLRQEEYLDVFRKYKRFYPFSKTLNAD